MIHFVPPHIEKVARQGAGARRGRSTSCSAISRTPFRPTPRRRRARASSRWREATDFGSTGLWTRINALNSPWALDDVTEIVAAVGNKLDVIMLPKVEGPWDIHYLDQLLAQLEARHAAEEADPDPRHPGDGAGRQQRRGDRRRLPAHARHEPRPGRSCRLARHEDDARRRRPSRLRGAGGRRKAMAPRASSQQDLWHYTIAQDGRRLRRRRHQAVLRPVRRLLRPGRLRGAVPQRLPDGLRRRLVAASDRRSTSPRACSRPIRPKSHSPRKSSRPCRTAPAP